MQHFHLVDCLSSIVKLPSSTREGKGRKKFRKIYKKARSSGLQFGGGYCVWIRILYKATQRHHVVRGMSCILGRDLGG